MVRIVGSHPTDPGSNPGEGTFWPARPHWRNWIAHQTSNLGVVGSNPTWGAFARTARSLTLEGGYGAMAARRIPDPKVGGSNPSSLILLQVCLSSDGRALAF